MCGRFYVPEKDLDDFAGLVSQIEKHLLKKAGEMYPGDFAAVITPNINYANHEETGILKDINANVHAIKWGFPTQKGKPIINARSETVEEKPLFKLPFATKRCLIPARSFFEWKTAENSSKRIKHEICFIDNSIMYLAGIYWFFKDQNGVQTPYFSVLTTDANSEMQSIHDRMPVIIEEFQKKEWLYENNMLKLKEFMKPMEQGRLVIKACS